MHRPGLARDFVVIRVIVGDRPKKPGSAARLSGVAEEPSTRSGTEVVHSHLSGIPPFWFEKIAYSVNPDLAN